MIAITLATLLCPLTGRAEERAWIGGAPSPAPATYFALAMKGVLRDAEGVVGIDLALRTRVEWAPWDALALGVDFPLQVSWMGTREHELVRGGIAPTSGWIGTGTGWDGGGFGVRVIGAIAPRTFGVYEVDLGAHAWAIGLALSAAHDFGALELSLELDAALASRNTWSGAGGGAIRALVGESEWALRPSLAFEARGSNDLGAGGRAFIGTWIAVSRIHALHVTIAVAWPGDPEAMSAAIRVEWIALEL